MFWFAVSYLAPKTGMFHVHSKFSYYSRNSSILQLFPNFPWTKANFEEKNILNLKSEWPTSTLEYFLVLDIDFIKFGSFICLVPNFTLCKWF